MKFATRTARIILTVILCMNFNVMSFAADTKLPTYSHEVEHSIVITTTTTKEERDAQFEAFMKTLIPATVTRGPQYHYKTEYFDYQYKTVLGFAGNQVESCYRFNTGGGFWFTDSGGSSVSERFVSVPETTHFYKLYVVKVIEVRPYALYRARSGTEDWELYQTGGVAITCSVDQYAKKVK